MTDVNKYRKLAHDIDPIHTKRWSPRSFLDKKVPKDVLDRIFEAARWAPSAANIQPWRFIIAESKTDKERFLSFINDGNVIWCDKAPVLVAIVSQKTWSNESEDINPTHAFDTGTAWGYLTLEATRQGLVTHGMGGFNREKAKEVLHLPDHYAVHAMVAIGYQGEAELLAKQLQEREKPSNRKMIEDFISIGTYKR